MPDERKRVVDAFSRKLDAAYHRAAISSYDELARRLEAIEAADAGTAARLRTHLSRSSAWAILKGRRERIPSWDKVSLLVRVFQAAATERGIPVETIGTLAEWKVRHEEAMTGYRLAPVPAPVPAPAPARAGASGDLPGGPQTWWHPFADIVPRWFEGYLNHEFLSDLITSYEPSYVPGLLQTRRYAAEIIALTHGHEPRERLDRRVELRMRRQRHLERGNGRPHMWAIINEGALRHGPVRPATMRGQIRHLLRLGPHVSVQILPASHPAHDAADGPITILRFGSLKLSDLVFLEDADSALYPTAEADRAYYQKAVNKLGLAALRPEPSKALLRGIENEL
ncbi:DUF5753 domain-containing protein [Actinomadura litoris]|uniref:DUF5753 domain-containing protein n=1 Tax=Actinomadura litoris TaxID=2678616 RepID=UPI001FA749AD|nr:DUF5753 domain-containing protein [Actinomadura litoris]